MKSALFIATEAFPFVQTGGLGDVIGSLPRELRRRGVDARVMLPAYSNIPEQWRQQMTLLADFAVQIGWRSQPCRIWQLIYNDLPCYFIENDNYFNRFSLYDWPDDAERFAFFCRAALMSLPEIPFMPAILHCHDWQTAPIPLLLKEQFAHRPEYSSIKTILTIHNLKYQGCFERSVLTDLLELNDAVYFSSNALEFHGAVSYLKAGLLFADALTTVSPAYGLEIQTTQGGFGLDGLLRQRGNDLTCILHGIDYDAYNPSTDPTLFKGYTWRSPQRKQHNKIKLQQLLGLTINPELPVLAMIAHQMPAKTAGDILEILPDLLACNVQLIIMGLEDASITEKLSKLDLASKSIAIYPSFDETLARRLFAASDLYLQPSPFEPCEINHLIAMRYGSIPIVCAAGGFQDTVIAYDNDTGKGNGFVCKHTPAQLLATLEQALTLYRDQAAWKAIVKNAMRSNFSWESPTDQYLALYNTLRLQPNTGQASPQTA